MTGEETSGPIRVLVVEDSPTQAQKLVFALEDAGLEAEVARSAEAALEILQLPSGSRFAAAISDVTMQGLDGFELCRRLRNDRRFARFPFLLLTTMEDPGEVVRGLECGADGFVSKPYDPEEIAERVRSLVRSRRLRDAAPESAAFTARFRGRTIRVEAGREQAVDLLLPALEAALRTAGPLEPAGAEQATAARLEELEARLREEAARNEELRKSAGSRSRPLDPLASEIRLPVAELLRMAGTLAQTPLSIAQRAYLSAMQSSTEALLAALDDLEDRSRLEGGPTVAKESEVDAGRILEDVAALIAESASAKGLEVTCYAGPGLDALRGDASRLRQVLLNLARNAVKFTTEGVVSLSAHLEREEGDGGAVRFEVKDTGIGIAPPGRDRLFHPSTGDGPAAPGPASTSRGLAVSRQLVELMGGSIGVESAPGEGSTFWFTARFPRAGGVPSRPRDARLDGKSVLVIDDCAASRDALTRILADRGMAATQAEEAGMGLEAVRSAARSGNPFAVVLLDLTLPGSSSLGFVRDASLELGRSAPPVVLLTSSARRRKNDDSFESAGVTAWLPKPVRRAVLFETIAHVLEERGTEVRPPGWLSGPEWDRPVPAARKGLVLVAEDNKVNQRVATIQLDRLGYDADVVGTGLEAVASAMSRPYGLVLMDCEMPGMDGFEATREIRKREGTDRHLPILAMTAHSSATEMDRCLAAGMDGFLQKPLSLGTLEEAISRWWASPSPTPSPDPGQ